MRRIAKVVLLLAPVFLASSGCATKPAWLGQKSDDRASIQIASSRVSRLLEVAQRYESQGKNDVAVRLYEHIITQDPECSVAKDRLVALNSQRQQPPEIRMASKGEEVEKEPAPKNSEVRPQRDALAELKPVKPLKRDSLNEVVVDSQEKRLNLIELTYQPAVDVVSSKPVSGDPDSSLPAWAETPLAKEKPAVAKSVLVAPALDSPLFAQARTTDELHTDKPEDRIAKPISKFETAAVAQTTDAPALTPDQTSTVAELSDAQAGQEWWDAPLAKKEASFSASPNVTAPGKSPALELESMKPSGSNLVELSTPVQVQDLGTEAAKSQNSLEAIVAEANEKWKGASVQRLCDASASAELIQVVALLDSREPAERIAGLIELGIQGEVAEPAAPAVRALLNDTDPLVRAHAAGTVRDIEGNNAEVVQHLTRLLTEKEHGVLRLTSYLLGQMGSEAISAVPDLERLRDQESGLTSLHAAEALTRIAPHDKGSYEVLKQALSSEQRECRLFVTVSLGGVYSEGEEFAAQTLKDALSSPDADVRASAALSLGGLGKHAEIALADLQYASDFDTPEVREAALTALACLGK